MVQVNMNYWLYIKNGATPLFIASQKDNVEVVKFLVENGSNVNQGILVWFKAVLECNSRIMGQYHCILHHNNTILKL